VTRTEVYKAVHIIGVGLVAACTEVLSEPDPITWRSLLKAFVVGASAAGLYWAKPPGVTVVPNSEEVPK
jgi:hypothetical protein